MSPLSGGGITKLSELEIDADKDWQAKKIDNIGAPDSLDDVGKGVGSLAAICIVVANDAKAEVKAWATTLQTAGYPVWVCDGVSDQVEINAAIAALPDATSWPPTGGGRIILSNGIFYINDAINLNLGIHDHTTISGQGKGTVLYVPNNVNADLNVININGATYCTIENLQIFGNEANQTAGNQYGVYIHDSYTEIIHCRVLAMRTVGIYCYGELNIITHCQVKECNLGGGITLGDDKQEVSCCELVGNRGFNLRANGTHHLINNNFIIGSPTDALGIECLGDDITIQGNLIYSNDGGGIYINSSDRNLIVNNFVTRNGKEGILLSTANDCLVSGNYFQSNSQKTATTYDNIRLTSDSNYNTVVENIVRKGTLANKPRYGINIDMATCDKNTVRLNNLYNAGETANLNDGGTCTIIKDNIDQEITDTKDLVRVKNTSGGALAAGDVVILKSVAAGNEITTTTAQGDDKVFGMVAEAIADTAYGLVQVAGKPTALKVNGTTDIAIGDLLGTFTAAGIAMKAAAGDMAFAIALEAYITDDSLGVIDAFIMSPRSI